MSEDGKMKAMWIYALYMVALFTGFPFLIGAIMAYLFKGSADMAAESHYAHQIGLFWRTVIAGVVSALLVSIGAALSATIILAIVGLPMMLVGGGLFLWVWVMTFTRSVRGLMRLGDGEPYPVPGGWSL